MSNAAANMTASTPSVLVDYVRENQMKVSSAGWTVYATRTGHNRWELAVKTPWSSFTDVECVVPSRDEARSKLYTLAIAIEATHRPDACYGEAGGTADIIERCLEAI